MLDPGTSSGNVHLFVPGLNFRNNLLSYNDVVLLIVIATHLARNNYGSLVCFVLTVILPPLQVYFIYIISLLVASWLQKFRSLAIIMVSGCF